MNVLENRRQKQYRVDYDGAGSVVVLEDDIPILNLNTDAARKFACLLLKYSGMEIDFLDGQMIVTEKSRPRSTMQ